MLALSTTHPRVSESTFEGIVDEVDVRGHVRTSIVTDIHLLRPVGGMAVALHPKESRHSTACFFPSAMCCHADVARIRAAGCRASAGCLEWCRCCGGELDSWPSVEHPSCSYVLLPPLRVASRDGAHAFLRSTGCSLLGAVCDLGWSLVYACGCCNFLLFALHEAGESNLKKGLSFYCAGRRVIYNTPSPPYCRIG